MLRIALTLNSGNKDEFFVALLFPKGLSEASVALYPALDIPSKPIAQSVETENSFISLLCQRFIEPTAVAAGKNPQRPFKSAVPHSLMNEKLRDRGEAETVTKKGL